MPHISPGNSKLGKTPNISLPPILTCGKDVQCKVDCYALKFFKMYKGVKKAWTENFEEYRSNPSGYFDGIRDYLSKKQVDYFRFHVSGDLPDKDYLKHVIRLAEEFPGTSFKLFTKRYSWANELADRFPKNLNLALSAWPGVDFPNPHGLPVAWLYDASAPDSRIPKRAFKCGDDCSKCRVCWKLKAKHIDVVFHKHR